MFKITLKSPCLFSSVAVLLYLNNKYIMLFYTCMMVLRIFFILQLIEKANYIFHAHIDLLTQWLWTGYIRPLELTQVHAHACIKLFDIHFSVIHHEVNLSKSTFVYHKQLMGAVKSGISLMLVIDCTLRF